MYLMRPPHQRIFWKKVFNLVADFNTQKKKIKKWDQKKWQCWLISGAKRMYTKIKKLKQFTFDLLWHLFNRFFFPRILYLSFIYHSNEYLLRQWFEIIIFHLMARETQTTERKTTQKKKWIETDVENNLYHLFPLTPCCIHKCCNMANILIFRFHSGFSLVYFYNFQFQLFHHFSFFSFLIFSPKRKYKCFSCCLWNYIYINCRRHID